MTWYYCRECISAKDAKVIEDAGQYPQCEFRRPDLVKGDLRPVSGRCPVSSGLVANWKFGGDD